MFGKKPPSDPAEEKLALTSGTTTSVANDGEPSDPKAPKTEIIKVAEPEDDILRFTDPNLMTSDFMHARAILTEMVLEQVNFQALEHIPREHRKARVSDTVNMLLRDVNVPLTAAQIERIKSDLLNDVLGFGPIEVLINDPNVSDIMINTHKQVYVEKKGKIALTDIQFSSEGHLLNTIQKIVSLVGRRVDEKSPMVDARMPDGSRFNAIIPPLAIDGSLVSIRKFKKNKMPLSQYVDYGSMTPEMVKFLEICGHIRLNIIISGGTGSGKTTMLNALSGHIDPGERVITIEDAAELIMHQPHVLRLETRPPNTEGAGEINQRLLVRNALRMRPDRIILGEIRGDEVIDVLAAMNTGHDGSMATIHSNNPRDCLSRIENLVAMSGISIPIAALRQQIASAVGLIIQVSRMRDGARRVTHIEEVCGLEGEIITTQTIFGYQTGPLGADGMIAGKFYCSGLRPRFLDRAQYFNRDKELIECLNRTLD